MQNHLPQQTSIWFTVPNFVRKIKLFSIPVRLLKARCGQKTDIFVCVIFTFEICTDGLSPFVRRRPCIVSLTGNGLLRAELRRRILNLQLIRPCDFRRVPPHDCRRQLQRLQLLSAEERSLQGNICLTYSRFLSRNMPPYVRFLQDLISALTFTPSADTVRTAIRRRAAAGTMHLIKHKAGRRNERNIGCISES